MALVPPLGLSRELLATPGDSLAEALEEHNLTPEMAAKAMQISTASLDAVISDGAAITADMAQRLAGLLGISECFWLNLQRIYEEELKQIEAREKRELAKGKVKILVVHRKKPAHHSTDLRPVAACACLKRRKNKESQRRTGM